MSYYKFFFVALLIGVSFAFYYIISPFFIAIVFALILARFFKKPYDYFCKRFNAKIASFISVVLVVVVFVIPFLLLISLLSLEASRGYGQVQKIVGGGLEMVQKNLEQNSLYQELQNNPQTVKSLFGVFFEQQISSVDEAFQSASQKLKGGISVIFKNIQGLLVNITNLMINFFIMLYLLYFFFREGENVIYQIKNFIPMKEEETQELFDEAFKIIDATVIGTLIIGSLEGLFGGFLFYMQGIPSPVTWGLIMGLLSMLPVLGTNGLLIPLAFYRLFTGNYVDGLVVLVVGCGGILISQNIIKPKLVGDRSGLHPALIVLSTLGGIYAIGISGFLLGPTIATLFVVFWKLFRQKNSGDSISSPEQ